MADPDTQRVTPDRPRPLVYTVPELVVMLHISRSQIYRLIRAGDIPVVRYGRSVRVPAWWVDEQLRPPSA